MCGISGALVFDGSDFRVDEPYLTKMRDTMEHRGPDGSGVWVSHDDRIGLAFRRLAIIDLSERANQPMADDSGDIRLVFNGEIYNHAEIRRELEGLGVRSWKTDHSDTEVIVRSYQQWGIDCIHRFRGMFAFALWDGRRRELLLVRDRIGIKPLYYSVHHGRITFASEIKALLEDPDQPRAVDEEALFHYLSFLTTPAPSTLFAGISKLPGGTFLRVRLDGTVSSHRYWNVWEHTEPLIGVSEDEIAERLLEELRTSVRYRKIADVPVGVFLSGGIDSSTNAALFSEGETAPVKTFSVGYEGDFSSYTNEFEWARRMAARVGADHHEITLTLDDLLGFVPRMVELQDEPIADPVCFPVYFVSKLARDNGMVVCQVGEGADELFCGYPYWAQALKFQRYSDISGPRFLKRAAAALLAATGRDRDIRYELVRRAGQGVPLFWSGAEAFMDRHKRALLSPRLRNKFADTTSWDALRPHHDDFLERAWDKSALNWMTHTDLQLRLPELLLMRVDKMSMGVSLEGRVPFLDHRFVELAMSIPTEVKLGNQELKHVLKKAVRGVIPDEFIDRPKQGFGVPIHEYVIGRLGDYARAEITDFCGQTDFFDRAEVDNLLNDHAGPSVWYLLNLALWWKTYIR